jgi:4-hydroxymandelate oxidase
MFASLVPAHYTIADLQEAARETLPRETYEFFETGARDEITAHENRCAWQSYWLVPRVLVDVSSVRTTTEVLGQTIDFPVLAAPMSVLGLAHPEGDLALVHATAAAGTIAILSQTSLSSVDHITHRPGARFWAQHYPVVDREVNAEVIRSAITAGAGAIVVTVDFPLRGVTRARPRGGFAFPPNDLFPERAARAQPILTSLTMDYIDWLQQIVGARVPIVVKGVLHPNDAVRLAVHGVNAIVVSNHGGRALDGAIPTAEALRPIVEAVQDRLEIYVDGGIRRGVDILRALSLGARAVLVGRPLVWGLAYAGEAGVAHVLGCLKRELGEDSALAGIANVRSIPPGLLRKRR